MADLMRDSTGKYPAYAWPGGYPVYYITADSAALCPACANGENGSSASESPEEEDSWRLVACEMHYEGAPLVCEHCNAEIESAYGPLPDPLLEDEGEAEIKGPDGTCVRCGNAAPAACYLCDKCV